MISTNFWRVKYVGIEGGNDFDPIYTPLLNTINTFIYQLNKSGNLIFTSPKNGEITDTVEVLVSENSYSNKLSLPASAIVLYLLAKNKNSIYEDTRAYLHNLYLNSDHLFWEYVEDYPNTIVPYGAATQWKSTTIPQTVQSDLYGIAKIGSGSIINDLTLFSRYVNSYGTVKTETNNYYPDFKYVGYPYYEYVFDEFLRDKVLVWEESPFHFYPYNKLVLNPFTGVTGGMDKDYFATYGEPYPKLTLVRDVKPTGKICKGLVFINYIDNTLPDTGTEGDLDWFFYEDGCIHIKGSLNFSGFYSTVLYSVGGFNITVPKPSGVYLNSSNTVSKFMYNNKFDDTPPFYYYKIEYFDSYLKGNEENVYIKLGDEVVKVRLNSITATQGNVYSSWKVLSEIKGAYSRNTEVNIFFIPHEGMLPYFRLSTTVPINSTYIESRLGIRYKGLLNVKDFDDYWCEASLSALPSNGSVSMATSSIRYLGNLDDNIDINIKKVSPVKYEVYLNYPNLDWGSLPVYGDAHKESFLVYEGNCYADAVITNLFGEEVLVINKSFWDKSFIVEVPGELSISKYSGFFLDVKRAVNYDICSDNKFYTDLVLYNNIDATYTRNIFQPLKEFSLSNSLLEGALTNLTFTDIKFNNQCFTDMYYLNEPVVKDTVLVNETLLEGLVSNETVFITEFIVFKDFNFRNRCYKEVIFSETLLAQNSYILNDFFFKNDIVNESTLNIMSNNINLYGRKLDLFEGDIFERGFKDTTIFSRTVIRHEILSKEWQYKNITLTGEVLGVVNITFKGVDYYNKTLFEHSFRNSDEVIFNKHWLLEDGCKYVYFIIEPLTESAKLINPVISNLAKPITDTNKWYERRQLNMNHQEVVASKGTLVQVVHEITFKVTRVTGTLIGIPIIKFPVHKDEVIASYNKLWNNYIYISGDDIRIRFYTNYGTNIDKILPTGYKVGDEVSVKRILKPNYNTLSVDAFFYVNGSFLEKINFKLPYVTNIDTLIAEMSNYGNTEKFEIVPEDAYNNPYFYDAPFIDKMSINYPNFDFHITPVVSIPFNTLGDRYSRTNPEKGLRSEIELICGGDVREMPEDGIVIK
jgi:hypothetical protein